MQDKVIAVTRANWGRHRPSREAIMSDWPGLDRFLAADPRDVDCEQALEILDVYVEMVLEDAPGLAARRFPGAAVHLAACGPCDEDFQGLLAAAGATP